MCKILQLNLENIPQKYSFDEYHLVPITTDNEKEDRHTIKVNAEIIALQRGGVSENKWPYVNTRKENYKDLAWLEICHKFKQLFSYVIRENKSNRYVGCVYLYPIELYFRKLANNYDFDFWLWITKVDYEKGKYQIVYKNVMDWFVNYWGLEKKKIYFRNNKLLEQQSK